MDIEIFDNLFEENFDGKKVPFVKSKGFIIAAVVVGIIALYVLFTRKSSSRTEESSYVSDVAYYRGQTSTGGSSGSYVNTSDILEKMNEKFSDMEASYSDRFSEMQESMNSGMSDMMESMNATLEEMRESMDKEDSVNSGYHSSVIGGGSSRDEEEEEGKRFINYYPSFDAAVDFGDNYNDDNARTLEAMARNSVLWHKTDDPKMKEYYASQNQILGSTLGADFNPTTGKWYTDETQSERLYKTSADTNAKEEWFVEGA